MFYSKIKKNMMDLFTKVSFNITLEMVKCIKSILVF